MSCSLIQFLPLVSKKHMWNSQDQGLRHADENGGDGDQAAAKPRFSSEGNPYQKPKTQRIWPTIFLKMGDYPPHSQKWGDATPPPVTEPLARTAYFEVSTAIPKHLILTFDMILT